MAKGKVFLTPGEKLAKSVGESFDEQFRSATDEKVKDEIVKFTQEIEIQNKSKKDNPKLIELKAQKAALSDGYKNLVKDYRTKIKYLLNLLESRGKL